MPEPIESDPAHKIALLALANQLSTYLEGKTPPTQFINFQRQCETMRLLPVFDAPDIKTFRRNAEHMWRLYHRGALGRPSEEQFIFEICVQLNLNGEINEKDSIGKLCRAVTTNLEHKREQDNTVILPHEDTIRKFVKAWKIQMKAMIEKGFTSEQIKNALIRKPKGRSYNPFGLWLSPIRKKKKKQ